MNNYYSREVGLTKHTKKLWETRLERAEPLFKPECKIEEFQMNRVFRVIRGMH